MTRVPLCLLGLALLALLVLLVARAFPTGDRAYTVDEVQAGLARQPAAWSGRIVVVSGDAASQGSLLSCWRATSAAAAPHSIRTLCPASGTVTLSLAPTASWVVHVGSLALRVSGPPLIVAQRAGAMPPTSAPLTALVAPLASLARLPLLAPLVAAVVPPRTALYRVRLLSPGHCDLPPAPCPQALMP